MESFIKDCEADYTTDIPAQMMYCQIRHLGGKSAVDRIFKRCNKNYDLDNIMNSLKQDQNDTSSSNQVGDTKFWSRHEKCYTFIKQYAKTEEKSMAVRIGSARSDEHGGSGWAGNAKAGDQKNGAEVSTQDWYLHSKGWVVIRAKDAATREKIAYAMQRACDNNNIGYDQSQRLTAQEWCEKHGTYDPGAITDPVETDCSALVRLCCAYAGIKVSYFNTASETNMLKNTGKFEILTDSKYTKSSDYLLRGDILNTQSQGHTVVVLSNGAKASSGGSTPVQTWKAIGTATCTADGVNVRETPGGKVLVQAGKGNRFEVDGQISGNWVHIKIAGTIGWMHKDYVKYDVPETPSGSPSVTINGIGTAKTDMNVRAGASTNDKIVGLVKKGEKVQIIEQLSSGWLKIVWKNGFAYVSNRGNQYFAVNSEFPYTVKITADALYIRKGPGTNYVTIGVVYKGEKYVISGIENEKWAKLKDRNGYISMKYAEKVK